MRYSLRNDQLMRFSLQSGQFYKVQPTNWPINKEQVAESWGAVYEVANSLSTAQEVVDP